MDFPDLINSLSPVPEMAEQSVALLSGDGTMGPAVRSFDWASTPLGPMASWPQSLRIAVGICLNSRFPMFVWWGPELINIYNDAYIPVLGKRHPKALGQPAKAIWKEIWEVVGPQADAVMLRGESTWNERVLLVMERNDYTENTYFNWSYSPIPGENNEILGLFCACTEETQRVRAEEAARALAEQRKLALDSAKMGWWHIDPVSGDVFFDERFRKIFGLTGDRLAYETVFLSIHPDDRSTVAEAVARSTQPSDPQPFSIKYRVIHPDGSVRWVHSQGQAYYESGKKQQNYTRFIGTMLDITDAKNVEDGLRESEARFRQLADLMPQIVWTARPDGTLDYYNRRWFEYIKLPESAFDLATWSEYLHPDDLPKAYEAWGASIRTGEPYKIDFRVRDAEGNYRWFLVRALPARNAGEQIIRWLGTCTDINEQRLLQERNQEFLASERAARSEAERVSHMKDEFLATLSHELRTPLNAILGWSQILRGGPVDAEDLSQGLETIERNARAQTQIIEDLLDMSRIISGKIRLDVQRLDLAAVIVASVNTVKPAADAKGIRIQSVLDPIAGPVSGDPNRLQQVFWNLLSNAVKFTPKEGRIQVLLERVNSHVEVSVIDTGEGIKPEFLPHVFGRFRQADASTTRRHGGLGLGLAIVKQLTELHGGTIRAKSSGAGQGATFIVSLPLTAIHPDISPSAAERRHPKAGGPAIPQEECAEITGVRILVVDDEPDARALVRRLLEDCGAIVTVAGSATEAFRLLQSGRPQVLVSDIGMPGEDGYSLIRRVRALSADQGGHTPAVALTAYARAEDRMKAIVAGFQHHVVKPVEPAELITMVASLANRSHS